VVYGCGFRLVMEAFGKGRDLCWRFRLVFEA